MKTFLLIQETLGRTAAQHQQGTDGSHSVEQNCILSSTMLLLLEAPTFSLALPVHGKQKYKIQVRVSTVENQEDDESLQLDIYTQ